MHDGLNGELVSFFSTDGIRLHGFLCKPKNRSETAVVYIHGFNGTFYRGNSIKALGRNFVDERFNFFSIELRGSYNTMGMKRKKGNKEKWILEGGSVEKFEECLFDIDGAIKFLSSKGIKKVFLIGHSTGCQKITYYQYMKKDRRVKGIILLAPGDDYNLQRAWLGKRFGNAVNEVWKIYKKDKNAMVPKSYFNRPISASRFLSFSDLRFVESRLFNYELPRLKEFSSIKQPVLAVFGTDDESALKPVNEYMKILKRNAHSDKFDYCIIKGADHGFSDKEKEMSRIVVNWTKGID